MFWRTVIAALPIFLVATASCPAQPAIAPDCTVDGQLTDTGGLQLDVVYRCRSTQPLSFVASEDRAAPFVSDLKAEQKDGLLDARGTQFQGLFHRCHAKPIDSADSKALGNRDCSMTVSIGFLVEGAAAPIRWCFDMVAGAGEYTSNS